MFEIWMVQPDDVFGIMMADGHVELYIYDAAVYNDFRNVTAMEAIAHQESHREMKDG